MRTATNQTNNTQIIQDFVQALLDGGQDADRVSQWTDWLRQVARITEFERGEMLVQHHALANDIHFLIEGTLRYRYLVTDEEAGETISHHRAPWMPIGWNSLYFHRYRMTIVADSDGRLLTVPLTAWQELAANFPILWAHLSEFMFRTTIQLLWEARGLNQEAYADVVPAAVELPLVVASESDKLLEMYQHSSCFSALPAD